MPTKEKSPDTNAKGVFRDFAWILASRIPFKVVSCYAFPSYDAMMIGKRGRQQHMRMTGKDRAQPPKTICFDIPGPYRAHLPDGNDHDDFVHHEDLFPVTFESVASSLLGIRHRGAGLPFFKLIYIAGADRTRDHYILDITLSMLGT
jgi:hypothetical protein